MNYTFYKSDFTNEEWWDLINATEDLPKLEDIFDKIDSLRDYHHLFDKDAQYDLAHDSLRMNNVGTVKAFMLKYSLCNNRMTDDVLGAIAEHSDNVFQFAGDGGELGFILDFYKDDTFEEALEMESQQFWFEDYQFV